MPVIFHIALIYFIDIALNETHYNHTWGRTCVLIIFSIVLRPCIDGHKFWGNHGLHGVQQRGSNSLIRRFNNAISCIYKFHRWQLRHCPIRAKTGLFITITFPAPKKRSVHRKGEMGWLLATGVKMAGHGWLLQDCIFISSSDKLILQFLLSFSAISLRLFLWIKSLR